MAHIVIVGALPISIVNFRGDLIKLLISQGHVVTAMSSPASADQIDKIEELGARFIPYPIYRNGLNPYKDFYTFLCLRRLFAQLNPTIVLAYTIKPVIWSGLALRGYPQVNFYAMIEGLGYAFQGKTLFRKVLMRFVIALYKRGLAKAKSVIFLNEDNRLEFLNNEIIESQRSSIIDGIGVKLEYYKQQPLPTKGFRFLMIARFLGEKGVREYLHAAQIIKKKFPDVQFQLLGDFDPSPDGLTEEEIVDWKGKEVVEFLDPTEDVRSIIASCNLYVLPSYHEGMPRTIMEAMAIGRPILTTNVPGCRVTVKPGVNGFIVPKGNIDFLVEKMSWFIENSDICKIMGEESRRIAENRFDVKKINLEILHILGLK